MTPRSDSSATRASRSRSAPTSARPGRLGVRPARARAARAGSGPCRVREGRPLRGRRLHDQHVRRARIEHAPDDSLGWTPPWVLADRPCRREHGALIQIVGDPEPELLADLDGTRVGKTRMRELAERYVKATNQRLINWTIVAYPNEGWATTVFGEPDVEQLWDAVALGDRGWTSPTRSRRGASTSRSSTSARRAERAARSTRSASAGPAPTSPSA